MQDAGFVDSYRELYKSAVTHPGFTYPSHVGSVVYYADVRDRIDYMYYYPNVKLKLLDCVIFGPSLSKVNNEDVEETGEDKFVEPLDIWPSDHKGVISKFKLYLD